MRDVRRPAAAAGMLRDPFAERGRARRRLCLQLLGGRFEFESDDPRLLQLVRWAYSGLPAHRLVVAPPLFRVRLLLAAPPITRSQREPPPTILVSGAGLLCAATTWSSSAVLAPNERAALLVVTEEMLKSPYHVRYELIELAVCTLAARAQGLVPFHGACVGLAGRGLLLVGPSGAGKSTVALQALLDGFDMLSEDSVFVAPGKMLATGIANFLHVRADSLSFVAQPRKAAAIRDSPIIRRRSGVEKFEVDLRKLKVRLAPTPLELAAVVVLSPKSAVGGRLLRPLKHAKLLAELQASQPYAAAQPEWGEFRKRVSGVEAFELRRGVHPRDAAQALREALR